MSLFLITDYTEFNMYIVSNCCGAEMNEAYRNIQICPECKEHCDLEDCDEIKEKNLIMDR